LFLPRLRSLLFSAEFVFLPNSLVSLKMCLVWMSFFEPPHWSDKSRFLSAAKRQHQLVLKPPFKTDMSEIFTMPHSIAHLARSQSKQETLSPRNIDRLPCSGVLFDLLDQFVCTDALLPF